ncbi:hypothetical protein OMO38_16630 [Chryseobacterium sp. 09-1422]|uniref:Uncharacterized protein n=1 Tax=Chryseobacterium kimseyorum TaxID=2984028 RepID=A0ABT3I2D4_9FLAO|nr:hypothetical protein [Chryseobacterium kimseyorum]MCW3170154.1 hypothetical protein [Chryseobacterium kimseyorum]
MNWIIRSTKTVKYHTNLKEILKPIWENLGDYHWIITDIDFMSDTELPINFNADYFFLTHAEFERIFQSNAQIIWGIISAVPQDSAIDFGKVSTLSAENICVWECNEFQIHQSIVEITAFDSGYTIVKFKDQKLSEKFKDYFQNQALDLQAFNDK